MVRVTMGCMSASDAAPLPRLGEVFFDVRGSSRSMRLSWYADTGVAVFSIWQGGMCTGTFRLAIADLPRMVETLERGPGGQEPGPGPEPTQAFSDVPANDATRAQGMGPLSEDELPDYRPGPPGYGPGSPSEQHAEQPDYRAAAEYLSERPDPLAGSEPYPTRALDYPAGPEGRRAGPAEYPAGPADPWAGPADYAADRERNGHVAGAGLPGYGDPPPTARLPDRRSGSSYPGRAPEAPYPGAPSDASYPGGRSGAPYPDPRSEGPFPGAGGDARGPYPGAGGDARGSYPGAGAEGPYPGARPEVPYPGPSDGSYPGPLPGAPFHGAGADVRGYPGGPDRFYHPPAQPPDASAGVPPPPSPSPFTGAAGRSDADYPAHYGAADDDDIPLSPPPESFPYGPPPGNRGPGGRHADPDSSFD
jgi:hypothetical protein